MLFLGFFEGLYTVETEKEDARAVFSAVLSQTIRAKKTWYTTDGKIRMTLFSSDYRRLCAHIEKESAPTLRVVRVQGMPKLLSALKQRPGVAVGAVLGLALLILSTQIVWRVDILCPDNAMHAREEDMLDLAAVRGRLTSLGISEGMSLSGFDSRHAEMQYLIDQMEVSWIAINRRGTVLSIEVRPSYQIEEDDRGFLLSDDGEHYEGTMLVANADGIIVRTELRNGTSQVTAEQMVTKGEVLATGVFESVDGDVRFSRVSGKVFAKTVRVLSVTLPFVTEEEVYSGESETSRVLRIFGREIALPRSVKDADENVTFLEIFQNYIGKGGFSAPMYDIIEDGKTLTLPGKIPLPIAYVTKMKNGKEIRRVREDRETLIAKAQRELTLMRQALTDAEIFETKRVIEETADAITVIWYVDCIDNIASAVPFTVERDGELAPR